MEDWIAQMAKMNNLRIIVLGKVSMGAWLWVDFNVCACVCVCVCLMTIMSHLGSF